MKGNKFVAIAVSVILLSGCSPLRGIFKHTESAKSKVSVTKDSVKTEDILTVDKTVTTTTKTTTGKKVVPKKQHTAEVNLDSLLHGQIVSIDSSWFKMTQIFDSATNNIITTVTRPADTISIQTKEEKTEYRDVNTKAVVSTTTRSDSTAKTSEKSKVVEKEPSKSLPYIIAFIVIVLFLFFFLKRR